MLPASRVTPRFPGPYKGLRIGLFGGSFNPAHEGHLHVAQTALKALQLDHVWWVVAAGNPLKQDHGDYDTRLASARVLTARHPRMHATDIERQLGVRYTADLLAQLRMRARDTRFVWIVGGDSLAGFHNWKRWQTISQSVPIAAIARPGAWPAAGLSRFARQFASARRPNLQASGLAFQAPPAWVYLPAPLNSQSSTRLRTASGAPRSA